MSSATSKLVLGDKDKDKDKDKSAALLDFAEFVSVVSEVSLDVHSQDILPRRGLGIASTRAVDFLKDTAYFLWYYLHCALYCLRTTSPSRILLGYLLYPVIARVIYPNTWGIFVWNLVVMFWVLYSAVVVPIRLGFDVELSSANGLEITVEYIMELSFLMDIYVSQKLAYQV